MQWADDESRADDRDVREIVREAYGGIAQQGCCCGTSCCGHADAASVAVAVGYSQEDLDGLPDGVNMGLSCGNPTAMASLAPGDVVLDLGSGGGFDAFIAGRKVGPSGRVIGVDMTPEMVAKARRSVPSFVESTSLDNVEFRLGEIEHLPVADQSIDVVISNCVINLSPDKAQVWREVARVLKPGGRVSVSDLALLQPLPEHVRSSERALVSCIAGAVLVDETREMVRSAGLDAVLETRPYYVDQMTEQCDNSGREPRAGSTAGPKLSEFVVNLDVRATKPDRPGKTRS